MGVPVVAIGNIVRAVDGGDSTYLITQLQNYNVARSYFRHVHVGGRV